MPSPFDDKTGVGAHLRESDVDLGKTKTTREQDKEVEALMLPRAKHQNRPGPRVRVARTEPPSPNA